MGAPRMGGAGWGEGRLSCRPSPVLLERAAQCRAGPRIGHGQNGSLGTSRVAPKPPFLLLPRAQDKVTVCWLPVPVLGRFQKASSCLSLPPHTRPGVVPAAGHGVIEISKEGGGGTAAESALISNHLLHTASWRCCLIAPARTHLWDIQSEVGSDSIIARLVCARVNQLRMIR